MSESASCTTCSSDTVEIPKSTNASKITTHPDSMFPNDLPNGKPKLPNGLPNGLPYSPEVYKTFFPTAFPMGSAALPNGLPNGKRCTSQRRSEWEQLDFPIGIPLGTARVSNDLPGGMRGMMRPLPNGLPTSRERDFPICAQLYTEHTLWDA